MTAPRRALLHRLVALAVPVFLHGSVMAGLFTLERWFARPMGVDVLAGLSIGTVVVWVLTTVFSAIGISAGLAVGASLARKDARGASRTLRSAVGLAGAASVAVMLAFMLAGPALVTLAFGRSTASALACGYLSVAVPGIVFHFMESALAQSFFGAGDTRTPLLGSLLSGGTTLTVLVFGTGVGRPIEAFAVASVLGALASSVWMFMRVRRLGVVSPLRRLATRGELAQLLGASAPTLSEKASAALGYFVFASLLGRLGSDALAANQALLSIGSLACLVPEALGVAASALVVRARAERSWGDLALIGRSALAAGAVALAAFGLVAAALRSTLTGVFLEDAHAQALAVQAALVFALMQPFMAIAVVLRATLRAEDRARTAFSITTVGTFLVRLPACLVLVTWFDAGLVGVWLAVLFDWIVQAGLGALATFAPLSDEVRAAPSAHASARHGAQSWIATSSFRTHVRK